MDFFRVYGRVIGLLKAERGLAIMLALANVAVAALQFYEPVLFGKVVDLLSTARDKPVDVLWSDARELLVLWAAVGIGGIVANIVVSLQADRMAHRRRLGAMATFFEHVLVLPFAFHHSQHSGRLLKVMLTGVDHLFGIWLSFFRENLATFVALFIMLPLSLFMNWRLGLLLIVLIVFFAVANAWVVGKTDRLQAQVEEYHSELAGRAGDALGNIHLIQSFVRLGVETSEMRRIIALAHDFGVEVVPHCGYLGAGFLATVHIAASMGDVLVERLGIDLEASPFGPFAEITNGVARVPQGPGLGHDPDPALIARYRIQEPNVIR